MNGGGLDDIAVGAPGDSGSSSAAGLGRVYIFFAENHAGCPTTVTLGDADAIITGTTTDGWFGYSVGSAANFFGAGLAGLIVGAPGPADIDTDALAGGAFLFSATTLLEFAAAKLYGQGQCQGCPGVTFSASDDDADWSTQRSAVNDRFGFSVAGVGDVDGDGFGDLVVGAIQARHSGALVFDWATGVSGYAVLYRGASGTATTLSAAPRTGFETLLFGHSVTGGADITGDGRPDILVGAPYYRETGASDEQGAVFAFSIDSGDMLQPAYGAGFQPVTWDIGLPLPELSSNSVFGWKVNMLGDFDGDNLGDWVASAPGFLNPSVDPAPAPCSPGVDNPQGGRLSGRVIVVNVGNFNTSSVLGIWPPDIHGRYSGEGFDKGRLGIGLTAGFVDDPTLPLPRPFVACGASGLTPDPAPPPPDDSELGRAYVFLKPLP